MATTAICTTYKSELFQATHDHSTTLTFASGNSGTSGQFTITVTTVAGVTIGMSVAGTGIGAGAVVSAINSQTGLTLSVANSGTVSGSLTFTAESFKLLLIKVSPARTFDGTQTNVGTPGTAAASATNVGTDEVTGTGYTSGGLALTNAGPVSTNPTTSAAVSFTGTIQWTGATISTTAAIIYSVSVRQGAAANGITANASGSAINRAVSVHDFGGTQSVTAGTLTLTVPTQDGTTGLIRIN